MNDFTTARITKILQNFWKESPSNTLQNGTGEKAWDEPLVGFAKGGDPLFKRMKEDIGPFYWTPEEAFLRAFPDAEITSEELSVISYVLPQTEATLKDQRIEDVYPAERWARSRWLGEQFNCSMRQHLAGFLTDAGYPAVAPERLPDFGMHRSERFGIASNWSERHTAFIAGLGTFGLSDGLITPAGKAMRVGSVVAKIKLAPTPRPYSDHQAYCLWYARGTCGACITRCPAGAITQSGHDKNKCRDYIRDVVVPFTRENYRTGATPCGLCQVKIPCETGIPV